MNTKKPDFSSIPSVDLVLKEANELITQWGHKRVSEAIRKELQSLRDSMAGGEDIHNRLQPVSIISRISATLTQSSKASLVSVFNLSGTVLHTNLGRALLPQVAVDALSAVATRPSNLEFDLETGKRGDRDSHVEGILCELCNAEAATVVNNNAAAVLLTLNTLAKDREVLVSRGELVEIGGAFRMPEIIRSAGCDLIEVGTTNRTHLKDYAQAICERTAMLLKVHTSNYRIEGFTKEANENELIKLAEKHDLPFVIDLGSGNLADFTDYKLPEESTVMETLSGGVDIVTFSGDKLLGGPQCGIIVGKKELISRIKSNPLKRALRADKMTLAALTEILRLYQNPEKLRTTLPTLRLLTRSADEIKSQAERIHTDLSIALSDEFDLSIKPCHSQVGSGALPVETLPSYCLAIRASDNSDKTLRNLASSMRKLPTPVIGRISNGEFILDLRCLDNESEFVSQLEHLGMSEK